MRILIVVHGFPPTHSAGAERQAERMARWLLEHGHHVEVFTLENSTDQNYRLETSSEVDVVMHRLYYNIYANGDRLESSYNNSDIGKALQKLLTEHNFDLVHIVSGYLLGSKAVEMILNFETPLVVSPMEYWFLCIQTNLIQSNGQICSGPDTVAKCTRCFMETKRVFRYAAQRMPGIADGFWNTIKNLPLSSWIEGDVVRRQEHLRSALNQADAVICNSHFLIEQFAKHGFATQHYRHIRQGLKIPDNIVQISSGTSSKSALRLIYIGQIQPHKGVDILIDAVIKLIDSGRKITLDLWGSEDQSPDYTQKLKARSRHYADIRWNGRYTGAKVWDVLADADALVIPSRWYENSPNVILEAYAMHIPAIGTDLGGMAELIEHEKSGLLFELDNADDLAVQITRLIDEPELLPTLREGIPPVKTIDDEMNEVMELYQQLLSWHKRTVSQSTDQLNS